MQGFEITLQDGTVIPGVIFANQSCYVHEPLCDSWGSIADMLKELDDQVKHFEMSKQEAEDMLHKHSAKQDRSLLTSLEVLAYLRISRSTMYRLLAKGELVGHKVGSTYRFFLSDVEKCVKGEEE